MDQAKVMEEFQRELASQELQKQQMNTQASSLSLANQSQAQMLQQQEPGLIKEQLSLGEELQRIDYLLRSWTIEINQETGVSNWVAPKNTDMVILSEYGVHVLREAMAWYLNKNTLLSNYDEEMIFTKMRYFAKTLNKLIFMNYNKMFNYPTIERCYAELKDRISDKVKLKKFTREILGISSDEAVLEAEVLKDMEANLEKELGKIREELFRDKLKRFPSILRFLQDSVHSTYLRAFGGQERNSLRRHMTVTETTGGISMPLPTGKEAGPMSFLKRR